jgi:hypothetical protein
MKLTEFLKKWRFNKSLLSEQIGLSTGGFYNKLSEKNPDQLTDEQKKTLSKLLKEDLYKDLEKLEI